MTTASCAAMSTADGGVDARTFLDVAEVKSVARAEAFVTHATAPLRDSVSPAWRETGVLGLEHWQWVALLILVGVAVLGGLLFTELSRHLARRITRNSALERQLEPTVKWPARVAWFSLLFMIGLPAVTLSLAAERGLDRLLKITLALSFFWAALRTISAWSDHFTDTPFVHSRPGSRALVNLTSRVLRFLLGGLAVMVLLSELGYSVTSVLAGLGIGGIALALGAQKTLENLFGAFALAVDQPIREGDFVKVDDFTGTVETIGLRSTRIRTLDRTVIALPNGKLADMRLETYAARDRMRLILKLGLVYGTTSAQLEQLTAGLKALLAEQPRLWSEGSSVALVNLGESALEMEVVAYFGTSDADEFRNIREQVLLGVLKNVETVGTQLAFRTVSVIQQPVK